MLGTPTKFSPGVIVMTRGVDELITKDEAFAQFVSASLTRHLSGDWGDLSEQDRQENELSLTHNLRLLSAYKADNLPKIWIITEADRSATTILFPDEY
jgi:hypothetical protein